MNRRTFLSTSSIVATTALSGCLDFGRVTDTFTANQDHQPNQNATPTDPPETDREWHGEYYGTDVAGTTVYHDGLRIAAPYARACLEVGVYTGPDEYDNSENIPDDEFTWHEARDGRYLWVAAVEVSDRESPTGAPPDDGVVETLPPAEWTAKSFTEETPTVAPLCRSLEADPTYYRVVSSADGTFTSAAYTNPNPQRYPRDLVFELPGRSIDVCLSDPPIAEWGFGL